MAEFTLPRNSKVQPGRHFPAPEGAKRTRSFKIYRWNPDEVVPGLYAIGEAACVSVHGANRLGSNSLLDLVVFGRAVANRAAGTIKPGPSHGRLAGDACDKALDNLDRLRNANGGTPTAVIRDNMQRTMQADAAVFRTGDVVAKETGKNIWKKKEKKKLSSARQRE